MCTIYKAFVAGRRSSTPCQPADRPTVALSICLILYLRSKSIGNAAMYRCRSKRNEKIDICFCARHDETNAVVASMRLPLSKILYGSVDVVSANSCFVREHETQLMTGCNGKNENISQGFILPSPLSMSRYSTALAHMLNALHIVPFHISFQNG